MLSIAEVRAEVGDLDRWAIHLEDPFSNEALADPAKPYIVVGDFSFPDAMRPHDGENQELDVMDEFAKVAGQTGIVLTCKSNTCAVRDETGYCRQRDRTNPLHIGFQKAASHILGAATYTGADVILTYKRMAVKVGTGNEPAPHLDAYDDLPRDRRRLVGMVSSTLTTQLILNPTCRDDYEEGDLKRIMGIPLAEAELQVVTLPKNKLAVMPMGIPHHGQIARQYVPQRHFMRWWVDI